MEEVENPPNRYREPFKEFVRQTLDTVDTPLGKLIQFSLLLFNLAACLHYVWGTTVDGGTMERIFHLTEYFFVAVFGAEYLLRLWSSENRWKFVFSFYGIIDLLTIIPVFISTENYEFLRGFRTLRIMRFLRYLADEFFFFGTLSKAGLQAIKTIFTVVTIVFIMAAAIYESEVGAPNTNINSYTDAVYFTVITLSTVGYGDITPSTEQSRFFTIMMIFAGMIFIPWQAGKLAKIIIVMDENKLDVTCPKCGLTRHDEDAVCCKMCGTVIFQEYEGST